MTHSFSEIYMTWHHSPPCPCGPLFVSAQKTMAHKLSTICDALVLWNITLNNSELRRDPLIRPNGRSDMHLVNKEEPFHGELTHLFSEKYSYKSELQPHEIVWIGPTANRTYFRTIRRTFAFEPKYVLGCSCDATTCVPVSGRYILSYSPYPYGLSSIPF
jgi:hypothetical protein